MTDYLHEDGDVNSMLFVSRIDFLLTDEGSSFCKSGSGGAKKTSSSIQLHRKRYYAVKCFLAKSEETEEYDYENNRYMKECNCSTNTAVKVKPSAHRKYNGAAWLIYFVRDSTAIAYEIRPSTSVSPYWSSFSKFLANFAVQNDRKMGTDTDTKGDLAYYALRAPHHYNVCVDIFYHHNNKAEYTFDAVELNLFKLIVFKYFLHHRRFHLLEIIAASNWWEESKREKQRMSKLLGCVTNLESSKIHQCIANNNPH
jgi:hypothetical protein